MHVHSLICWLRGHIWHFYAGNVEVAGTALYYECERCRKRA